MNDLQGSRAWFDFPVLAWLGRCLDGSLLASLAFSLRLPLEFSALRWEGNFIAMPIRSDFDAAILGGLESCILQPSNSATTTAATTTATAIAGTGPKPVSGADTWCYGPFPAGKGMICAVDADAPDTTQISTRRTRILTEASRLAGHPPRANVYSIALIELHWYPGPDFGSSWAILSSAVAGRLYTAGRPEPVNGATA